MNMTCKSINGGTFRDKLYINSSIYDFFVNNIKSFVEIPPYHPLTVGASFSNLNIISSPHIPIHPVIWVFPDTPFVIYEESDKKWAIPLGVGCYKEDRNSYVVFLVKDVESLTPILLPDNLYQDRVGVFSKFYGIHT
jgi:hypothetical protein